MTLEAGEFMRRFLLHVLPSGFHRIRHYGLLANPVRRANLAKVRALLDVVPELETKLDGVPQSEIVKESGLTKQRVSGLINRVLAVAKDIPQGWERVDVWLPPALAAQVREVAKEARDAYMANLDSEE
jgi:hypothetical protein